MRFSLATVNCLLRYPTKSKPGEYFSAGKATGYTRREDGLDGCFLEKSDGIDDGVNSILSQIKLIL
jgi:hypothetical protein